MSYLSMRKLGLKLFSLFLFSHLLLNSTLCLADKHKPLVVGVENHDYFPHYQFIESKYAGFARDLLDEFAKDYGYQPAYQGYTVKELFQAFKRKKIMLKYPDNPIWSFEGRSGLHIAYSNPVIDYIDGIMSLSSAPLNNLSELKVLGTVDGFTPFPILNLVKQKKIEIAYFEDLAKLVKAVQDKQIDAIYVNIDVCNYYLSSVLQKPGLLRFDPTLPYTSGSYYLSSSSRPDVIREFNAFLYTKREFVGQLKKKYQLTSTVNLLN